MKFLSLANRNLKEIYRDPITVTLGIFMPVVLLLLFSSLYKRAHVDMFSPATLTPGIIIFSFAFLIMFCAVLLAKDRQSSFLIRLFTMPLKASDFILSYLLPFIPLALFQLLICFAVGFLIGGTFSHFFVALLIFLLIALTCICLGIILGSLFTINQVSGIGSILITVVSLFSGAWMDLKMVGGIFEKIGYALPFAHAVDISKAVIRGTSFSEISHSLTILLIYTVVFFILAIFSFRRAMKKI